MTDVFSDEQVRAALADLPGWEGDHHVLRRAVEFPDFPRAIRAVTEVADLAERMNHHPDMDIRWRTVHFALSTHSAGGVTAADLDLARGISRIVAA